MTAPEHEAKIAELRAATRDANTAIKDARAAKRELGEAVEEFRRDAHDWRRALETAYQAEIDRAIRRGIDDLMKVVKYAEKRLEVRMDSIMMAITKPYDTSHGKLRLDEIVTRRADGEIIDVPRRHPYRPA